MTQRTKENVLDTIAKNAGITFHTTGGFKENAVSVAAHAGELMTNAAKIADIGKKISSDAEAPSGGGFLKTALTTGALAIGMAVVPGVAAVAAAAVSVGESTHFGLKGNAAKGEMTLNNAAAAFDNGVYISAFDGQASDVVSGKAVSSLALMGEQPAPARGRHNIQAVIAEATAGLDPEQVRDDLMAKFRQNKDGFGQDMGRLRDMDAIKPNDPNIAAAEKQMGAMGEGLKLARPTPVMGIPMAFGLG